MSCDGVSKIFRVAILAPRPICSEFLASQPLSSIISKNFYQLYIDRVCCLENSRKQILLCHDLHHGLVWVVFFSSPPFMRLSPHPLQSLDCCVLQVAASCSMSEAVSRCHPELDGRGIYPHSPVPESVALGACASTLY